MKGAKFPEVYMMYTLLYSLYVHFLKVAFLVEKIVESSLLLIIFRTIPDNVYDPGRLTLTQGHQEKWIQKVELLLRKRRVCIIMVSV